MSQYPILNQITQTHNENYISQLFEELVSLNIKAMEEAKRRQSRQITWVPIKQLQEATGWGRTKLEEWRDQGKFQFQQSGKGGKYLYNLEDVQRFCRSLQK
nr:MAG TPA: Pyocin activator protein PrtN [Caudoviricetes sp.]